MSSMKLHNFSAGPAILPQEVLEQASKAVVNFNGIGLSLLEISHRSKDFIAVMDEATALVKELLNIGEDFEVLFLSGGASSQFFMVPMNILDEADSAAYSDTGTWASKAIKEAKLFGNIDVVASSKTDNYMNIPKSYELKKEHKYFHITSNNTIYGTQYHTFPNVDTPLVCDMSSDIFSRPFDVNKFDVIYAGAQKNMGPAGTTLVIIRKSILGKVSRNIPAMLDYKNHIENGSMYNTPPVFPIYVSMLTLRWIKNNGGLEAIEQKNIEKASILYREIERNTLFYCPVANEDRSLMNVCFLLKNIELENDFLNLAKQHGCSGLAGHRSVGGFRASIYNAMDKSSVEKLVELMQTFEKSNA